MDVVALEPAATSNNAMMQTTGAAFDGEHRRLEEGSHPRQPRGEIAQRAAGGERDDEAERDAHERVGDGGPEASGQDQVRPDIQGVDRAREQPGIGERKRCDLPDCEPCDDGERAFDGT